MAGRLAGPGAGLAVAGAADRGADVAGALADPAAVLGPVAELGDLDLRQGDRHELPAGLADHLAVRDVLTQVGFDLAPDDLLEPIGVTVDFSNHGYLALSAGYGGLSVRSPRNSPPSARKRSTSPSGLSGPPSRKSKDLLGGIRLGTMGRGGSRTIRSESGRLSVPVTQDPLLQIVFLDPGVAKTNARPIPLLSGDSRSARTGFSPPGIRITTPPDRPAIPGCPARARDTCRGRTG